MSEEEKNMGANTNEDEGTEEETEEESDILHELREDIQVLEEVCRQGPSNTLAAKLVHLGVLEHYLVEGGTGAITNDEGYITASPALSLTVWSPNEVCIVSSPPS